MVRELKELKIELMVSVWPTVDARSENYQEMLSRGYLVRTERGVRTNFEFEGSTVYYDATHPGARAYLWSKIKQNYHDKGIRSFWLDQAEPEYATYDFDHFRYARGPCLSVGNIYPRDHAQGFYEGMKQSGQDEIVNLTRCAWIGSQKYGALIWSGDISSSWYCFENQIAAGLNMGIAGLPWWTTDIGGFHGGDPDNTEFRELFVRWFQWGAFCPVMRLHGDREPKMGMAASSSGASNEVWSYGDEVYEICKTYLEIRERLRPYTRRLMLEAHQKGSPVIRPLFYEFPSDERCWETGAATYMYGDAILCCPVTKPGVKHLEVYLPLLENGDVWQTLYRKNAGNEWAGNQVIAVSCELAWMPTFVKKSKAADVYAA